MKKAYIPIAIMSTLVLIFLSYLIYNQYEVRKNQNEILRTFKTYEERFNKANKTLDEENEALGYALGPAHVRARRVQAISDSFFRVIESLKKELEQKQQDVIEGRGDWLQKMIDDTRVRMLAQVESATERDSMERACVFKVEKADPNIKQRKVPLAFQMAILTKIQNDCKSLETDILVSLAKDLK